MCSGRVSRAHCELVLNVGYFRVRGGMLLLLMDVSSAISLAGAGGSVDVLRWSTSGVTWVRLRWAVLICPRWLAVAISCPSEVSQRSSTNSSPFM